MNRRERPAGADGAISEAEDATNLNLARGSDLPEQLRRRRAESRRLTVLDCGHHRDPIDCSSRVPRSLPSTLAARRAWAHLRDHGLIDSEGWLEAVLAEGVAS